MSYLFYNHGNAEDLIFRESRNYGFFLDKYKKYVHPIGDTYAYCLMPNHFHVMVKVKNDRELLNFFHDKNPQGFRNPEGLGSNLPKLISHQFGTFLNSYTKSYNSCYNRQGSLFLNTTKRKPVTNEVYYTQLILYIHQNPVIHGFAENIVNWPFSSYQSLLSEKPTLLQRREVFDWFGGREEFIRLHKNYE